MTDLRGRAAAFVAEIDQGKLALLLMERAIEAKMPPDADIREALEAAIQTWPAECGPFPFIDMARIAIEYFGECVGNGSYPS